MSSAFEARDAAPMGLLRYVLDDACLRCSRPFTPREITHVVRGGPDAKVRDIGLVVCGACVQPPALDITVAQTLYFPGPRGLLLTWPRYVGTAGCPGFLKLARLENGVYRLGLHRGHAEVWTADEVARFQSVAATGVYTPDYQLYGPPHVIPNGIRQLEVRFVDCETPEAPESAPAAEEPTPAVAGRVAGIGAPSEYSRALEEQLALCRWFDTADAAAVSAHFLAGLRLDEPIDQHYRQLAATLRRATVIGEPYYWSPPMCRLLQDVAATVPDSWMPAPTSFPTTDGFAWFAAPLPLPTWPGGPGAVRAITWSHDPDPAREVLVCVVVHCIDPRRPAGLPTHYLQWTRGTRLGEILATQGMRAENSERAVAKLRCLAAMFALLEQRIIVSIPQRASRAVRRRLAHDRVSHEPLIRVVMLRRPATRESHIGTTITEWSCQWVVRGHWRMQWCPAAQMHRPMWILPYVKGPEDKPLKSPATTLFAVVR